MKATTEGQRHNEESYESGCLGGKYGDKARVEIAKKLAVLLKSCFEFQVNPLPGLRRVFPEYIWEYGNTRKQKVDIGNNTQYADFLADFLKGSEMCWCVNGGSNLIDIRMHGTFVRAKRKGEFPLRCVLIDFALMDVVDVLVENHRNLIVNLRYSEHEYNYFGF